MSNITINKSTQWGKFVYNMASFYRNSDWERNGAITLCSTFWYFLWGLVKFVGLVTLASVCLIGLITVISLRVQGLPPLHEDSSPVLFIIFVFFGLITTGAITITSALLVVGSLAHIFIYTKEQLEDKYGQGGWAPRKESQFVKTIKEAYRGWKDKYCPMIDVVEK